jgi:hypothetical protein
LVNFLPIGCGHLQKHVAREQGLLKDDRLASVLVDGAVAGQGNGDFFFLAVLSQLFFAARSGVNNEPE